MVALQIHGVSEPTRRTLSAEARARGESLQEYLLAILDREAGEIGSSRRIAEWQGGVLEAETAPITFVRLMGDETDRKEPQLAQRG